MSVPTFNAEIRVLFRQKDINMMKRIPNPIDLESYTQVRLRAEDIYSRLNAGDMPCDGAWPPADVTKFRDWIDGGCLEA